MKGSASALENLAGYLPRVQLRTIAAGHQPGTAASQELCSGSVVLFDVSGFTELTERFAERGPAGAEQICEILNAYFGRMTDIITCHGGDVLSFAGDATLAMWRARGPEDLASAARAARAALTVQSELRRFEPPYVPFCDRGPGSVPASCG